MMCDVRLIYLGDNKYGEIRCKPEVLSPLPKLIQPKQEATIANLTMITLLIPAAQEVVVVSLMKIKPVAPLLLFLPPHKPLK